VAYTKEVEQNEIEGILTDWLLIPHIRAYIANEYD
jgi:hypothetical protein